MINVTLVGYRSRGDDPILGEERFDANSTLNLTALSGPDKIPPSASLILVSDRRGAERSTTDLVAGKHDI